MKSNDKIPKGIAAALLVAAVAFAVGVGKKTPDGIKVRVLREGSEQIESASTITTTPGDQRDVLLRKPCITAVGGCATPSPVDKGLDKALGEEGKSLTRDNIRKRKHEFGALDELYQQEMEELLKSPKQKPPERWERDESHPILKPDALSEETKSPTKSPLPSRALEITEKPQPQYRDLGATGAATPKDELDER